MSVAAPAALGASAGAALPAMVVAGIELRDFRSYADQSLELVAGLNVFVGPNGAGKTNLLEAVHVALQGFALRTRRDVSAIRFGADAYRVAARGSRPPGVGFTTTVATDRRGDKRVELDGAPATSLDDLRRTFAVLAFTPDRVAVVKGGPIVRRLYLDRTLGRLLPARAELPAGYAAALSQRNAALRRVQAGVSSAAALTPWNETVARLGAELDAARAMTVEQLAARFANHAQGLGLDAARVRYEPSGIDALSLERRLARDIDRGTTGMGPHLAELELSVGDRDLRLYGSQGQQRLAVLALLLAEADILSELRGAAPLLLLDDVLSELDDARREALLAGVPPAAQVVVTATSTRALPAGGRAPSLVVDVTPGSAKAR